MPRRAGQANGSFFGVHSPTSIRADTRSAPVDPKDRAVDVSVDPRTEIQTQAIVRSEGMNGALAAFRQVSPPE